MNERDAILKLFAQNPAIREKLQALHAAGQLKTAEEIPPDQEIFIVGGPWPGTLIGNKLVRCESCNAMLAISPSTQQLIAGRPGRSRLSCLGCVARLQAKGNDCKGYQ
jgi:hypothetical protein